MEQVIDMEVKEEVVLQTNDGPRTFKVVDSEKWLKARKEFLIKEKELTRLRDELTKQRSELPWEKVGKQYSFEGPNGKESLSDLFNGKSQLIIYHFMFNNDWEEGCVGCSFWADNFNGIDTHLKHRDITFIAIAQAQYDKIKAYKEKMGWTFKLVSSADSDFNYDYHVSFDPKSELVDYNFKNIRPFGPEGPAVSVFVKDSTDDIFHSYSCYSRDLDMLNGAYNYIDLTPKGRDEKGPLIERPAYWFRRHNQYND